MADQWMAVYHKATGALVSVGTFVQGAEHCICSHSANENPGHPIGVETVETPQGERVRPLGCTVSGCFHNYEVPTRGQEIRRATRPGLAEVALQSEVGGLTYEVGPVLWQDDDGTADAAFVSDPLADDLAAVPIDWPPPQDWKWDSVTLAIVEDVTARDRRESKARVIIDAQITDLLRERETVRTENAIAQIDEQILALKAQLAAR